ncbi:MAG: lactate oxidase [Parabacteroides sp.]|nr:lactate oxidase [Parabacteroides sp.]
MSNEQVAYTTSTAEKPLQITDIYELEKVAEKLIPSGGWGYLHGGAGDEWTMRQNTKAFNHKTIIPRILANMDKPELQTSIFGTGLRLPVIMAPVAAQGLANEEAEEGTAKGVAAAGTIMAISSYAGKSIEEIAKAGGGAPQWFQLYLSKDDGFNRYVLDQAKENGMKAVVLTADATVGGNREADIRNHFTFPLPMANLAKYGQGKGQSIADIYARALQKIAPADIEKVAAYTGLPVIVKGVQSPADAMLAIGAGAAGIYVSNHGGRQLDGGPASFDVLQPVAEAVDKRVPVIFDSGIRRGQHIFKALADGADIVAIGRPAIYGLAVGGWEGVKSVFDYFYRELEMVMQLAGTKTIEDIKNTHLVSRLKLHLDNTLN